MDSWGDPQCNNCHGLGKTRTGPEDWAQCVCAFRKVFAHKVGVELAEAAQIRSSPLFTPSKTKGKPVEVDLTDTDLFIKGWWEDLLPHFRLALLCMHLRYGNQYTHLIVTDERLKSVYLGAEAYTTQSRKKRDDMRTFNTLSDLVGETQNLVIVRLGFLGYPNKAMPGILRETLMIRQALKLPTWVVEEPNSIFGPGHFSYNEDLATYIESRYKVIDLVKEKKDADMTPRGVADMSPVEGITLDNGEEPEAPKITMPKERFKSKDPALSLDPLLHGGSKKQNFTKKRKGGGPL